MVYPVSRVIAMVPEDVTGEPETARPVGMVTETLVTVPEPPPPLASILIVFAPAFSVTVVFVPSIKLHSWLSTCPPLLTHRVISTLIG
jgi:hypothetical protein